MINVRSKRDLTTEWQQLEDAIFALRYLTDDDLGGPVPIERVREAVCDVVDAFYRLRSGVPNSTLETGTGGVV